MPKLKPRQTSFGGLFVPIEYEENVELIDVWDTYEIIAEYKGKTEYYRKYMVPENSRLTHIAENIYGTQMLWWFILLFNEVVDPFEVLLPGNDATNVTVDKGTVLNIIRPEFLPEIFASIREAKTRK